MKPCTPLVRLEDPAGLDKLLLAVGKVAHDFVAAKAARFGVRLDWWGGADGLENVIHSAIEQHKIPNRRFQEIVSPRIIAESTGLLKRKRRLNR